MTTKVTTDVINDGAVTGDKLSTSGMIVQSVFAQTTALTSGTTTTPTDDTIPQSGEGTQFMSQQITPTSSANYLLIEVTAVLAASAAVNITMALFKDAGANALAAVYQSASGADVTYVMTMTHRVLAGSTSLQEFKVRMGGSGASTIYMNGYSGGRIFGGVCSSTIKITEVKV